MKNRQSNQQLWSNRLHTQSNKNALVQLSLLKMTLVNAKSCYALTLAMLGMLLPGCASPPQPPCKPLAPPSMPALSLPLPLVSYSIQAQENIKSWQKTLNDTSATLKP